MRWSSSYLSHSLKDAKKFKGAVIQKEIEVPQSSTSNGPHLPWRSNGASTSESATIQRKEIELPQSSNSHSTHLPSSLNGTTNPEAPTQRREVELPESSTSHSTGPYNGGNNAEAAKIRKIARREIPSTNGSHRLKWHQELEDSHNLLQYLLTGQASAESICLQSLKRSTIDYLRKSGRKDAEPSSEHDEILGALINEHGSTEKLRDIAILACLDALSVPAAARHLSSLINFDVERYLRCITLAGQANPFVVPVEELCSAQSLLRMIAREGQAFQEFQFLIENLGLGPPATFTTLEVIHSALARANICFRLQKQLDAHLEQKKFLSYFHCISWLQNVSEMPNSNNITAVLNRQLPSWSRLSAWRPNVARISQWENRPFTKLQRKKLSHAFDLDGPDNVTQSRESLATDNHEIFMDLLYKASILGSGALELFIHLCIDKFANDYALSTVDDAIRTGDDSYCNEIRAKLLSLDNSSSLYNQMRYLIQALPVLKNVQILENVNLSADELAGRLSNVMHSAQVAFCRQLLTGTGENIGMLIFNLGNAILQASHTHSNLPRYMLDRIRQFPSQDVLEVIFDQLGDYEGHSNLEESRFKSYLESALGGGGNGAGAGSMALTTIQEEVQFWKHPPDALRKELARTFAKIQSLDYSLYTSCLLTMLREDDIYIRELRHMIRPQNEEACLGFIRYLARRRRLQQLQHDCWLLLLASIIKEQAPSFLPGIADSMPLDRWLEFVNDLTDLFQSVLARLPHSGAGLTRERLSWWGMISRNSTAVGRLINRQGGEGRFAWLFFLDPPDHVVDLLEIIGQGQSMPPIHRQILSFLEPNGSNIMSVYNCARAIKHASSLATAVCQRMISRKCIADGEAWSEPGLSGVFNAWNRSRTLSDVDKSALEYFKVLLVSSMRTHWGHAGSQHALGRLKSEYETLLTRARELEILRLRLWHNQPQRISNLLHRLGIDNSSNGQPPNNGIPDELIDAIEMVGETEYELSFALTGLSDLQRRARGISQNSRLLLVRLCLQGNPKFCIHFSPSDEGRSPHNYWRVSGNHGPVSPICTTQPNLFTYFIGRTLHKVLQRRQHSLQSIYSTILNLTTASPTICLHCSNPMSIKLWKPAACSSGCSVQLRAAPLEVRLHNLLVDTLAIDLLLTCVYAAAAGSSNPSLLPGCPVATHRIRGLIDSIPPLSNLQTATDLRAAIQGHDGCGGDRENLLSWLCLNFRGFILAAPQGFRVPSMPNTHQFLLPNSSHEREALFRAQSGSQSSSGTVFHGTSVERLFLILTEGLKSLSGTSLMLHGASGGSGIYCGNEQATSMPYARSTGQSWRNSALSNMSIMLGCELASYTAPAYGDVHVIANEQRLLVRYVFLLPVGYQPPLRRHVEPAMSAAFAMLRSGLLT